MEQTMRVSLTVQQSTSTERQRCETNNPKPASGQSICLSGLIRQDKLASGQERSSLTRSVTLEPRGTRETAVRITCGFAPWRFGDCLIATSEHGICWLDPAPSGSALSELQKFWNVGRVRIDHDIAAQLAAMVFDSKSPAPALHLRGTEFQLRVWQALLGIRAGNWMSYGTLAHELGMPRAARAVGRAVGANNLAVLVPCHRVLPSSGLPGHYRWGTDLKKALLGDEVARDSG
jgi:AraC family transcriptional regulator of adaptative response/methylated-DNA-[protein]-cysteine methyltransferase